MPHNKNVPKNACPENRSYCTDYKPQTIMGITYCKFWDVCRNGT